MTRGRRWSGLLVTSGAETPGDRHHPHGRALGSAGSLPTKSCVTLEVTSGSLTQSWRRDRGEEDSGRLLGLKVQPLPPGQWGPPGVVKALAMYKHSFARDLT